VDYSFNVVENPVHVRDLHATALHLLGIEHERFTYRYQGLDFHLTSVDEAKIIHEILR
ncbi:MAG TPA: sulfatase, partial [Lentisphaeria bacterium]|nr:sulfatase [Lentisphaeria bacterium]